MPSLHRFKCLLQRPQSVLIRDVPVMTMVHQRLGCNCYGSNVGKERKHESGLLGCLEDGAMAHPFLGLQALIT